MKNSRGGSERFGAIPEQVQFLKMDILNRRGGGTEFLKKPNLSFFLLDQNVIDLFHVYAKRYIVK